MSNLTKLKKQSARKERIRKQKYHTSLLRGLEKKEANRQQKIFKDSKALFRTIEEDGANLLYAKEQVKAQIKNSQAFMERLLRENTEKYFKLDTSGCTHALDRIQDELEPQLIDIAKVIDEVHDQRPGSGRTALVYESASKIPEAMQLLGEIMAEYNEYAKQQMAFVNGANRDETTPASGPAIEDDIEFKDDKVVNDLPPDVEVAVDEDTANQILEERGEGPLKEPTLKEAIEQAIEIPEELKLKPDEADKDVTPLEVGDDPNTQEVGDTVPNPLEVK